MTVFIKGFTVLRLKIWRLISSLLNYVVTVNRNATFSGLRLITRIIIKYLLPLAAPNCNKIKPKVFQYRLRSLRCQRKRYLSAPYFLAWNIRQSFLALRIFWNWEIINGDLDLVFVKSYGKCQSVRLKTHHILSRWRQGYCDLCLHCYLLLWHFVINKKIVVWTIFMIVKKRIGNFQDSCILVPTFLHSIKTWK